MSATQDARFRVLPRDMNLSQRIGADFGGFILDQNHGFYQIQKEGDALVATEKVLVGKRAYRPLALGTPRKTDPSAFLIKEDGFSDIGGGYATVIRHYAKRPKNWFDYEPQECLLYDGSNQKFVIFQTSQGYIGFVNTTQQYRGVNYEFIGSAPSFRSFGYNSRARRQMTFLCKATRYYLTLDELNEYKNNDFSLAGIAWEGTSIYPDGIADNTFTTYNDGEGGTYQKPNHLFVNEPRFRIHIDSEDSEGAIAPDRIKLWHGNIYELTRYVTSIL